MRKATEQVEKDFKVVTVIILPVVALLLLVYVCPFVFAQVEVKQSVTTNDSMICRGAQTECQSSTFTTNSNKVPCNGLPSVCDKMIELNSLTVMRTYNGLIIHYCKETCHTYRIDNNGTMSKVN